MIDMEKNNFIMKPIGIVKSKYREPSELHFACKEGKLTETISEILLKDEFAEGLHRIDEFSHLWIIYLLDKAARTEMKTYPGPSSIKDLPKAGIFATRSQYRPNKIALRLVRFIKKTGNIITVGGLDAINGSKVIDIKPYISHFDLPENFIEPKWCKWK